MSIQSNDQAKDHPKLTSLIAGELRALPMQRAPVSLQARVFAELARRQALPWWQQSFRHWPMVAQAGFAVVALAVVHGLFWVLAGPHVNAIFSGLRDLLAGAAHWLQIAGNGAQTFHWVFRDLVATLPARWLMAAAVSMFSAAALMLGSGTLIYRIFSSDNSERTIS